MSDQDSNPKQTGENELVAALLKRVPDGSSSVERSSLEKVIRCAFSAGWDLAIILNAATTGEIN